MWKRKGKGFSIGVIGSIKNYSRKIKKVLTFLKLLGILITVAAKEIIKLFASDGYSFLKKY